MICDGNTDVLIVAWYQLLGGMSFTEGLEGYMKSVIVKSVYG